MGAVKAPKVARGRRATKFGRGIGVALRTYLVSITSVSLPRTDAYHLVSADGAAKRLVPRLGRSHGTWFSSWYLETSSVAVVAIQNLWWGTDILVAPVLLPPCSLLQIH